MMISHSFWFASFTSTTRGYNPVIATEVMAAELKHYSLNSSYHTCTGHHCSLTPNEGQGMNIVMYWTYVI